MNDLFYHLVRLNAAELFIFYTRMIVLDYKVSNLLWTWFSGIKLEITPKRNQTNKNISSWNKSESFTKLSDNGFNDRDTNWSQTSNNNNN